ncbi:MAG: hypothetical protein ACUVRL_00950 [Candidatus Saccharicenans sp.]|uniref:hypothetical protein n=1 Tax=Candidatus Saccharicenans sp. TaxID=2819258 RepID=UPI00404A1643
MKKNNGDWLRLNALKPGLKNPGDRVARRVYRTASVLVVAAAMFLAICLHDYAAEA